MVPLSSTQPRRLSVFYGGTDDRAEDLTRVGNLLSVMEEELSVIARDFDGLKESEHVEQGRIVSELRRSLGITRLRARQSRALIEYAVARSRGADGDVLSLIAEDSSRAMSKAKEIVDTQELHYRVDPERIAA